MRVDRARDELLARPALPLDEDRRPRGTRQADEVEDLPHRLGLSDDPAQSVLARELLLQAPVLLRQAPRLRPLADRHQDFLVLEGLGDVVERPLAHGLDRALDRRVRGHDHDDRVRVPAADLAQDLEAGTVGKHEVEEDDVEGIGLEELERLRRVRRGRDVPGLPLEEALEHVADDLLVVHDEDPERSAHERSLPPAAGGPRPGLPLPRGRSTRSPRRGGGRSPGRSRGRVPCLPIFFVVKKGWKTFSPRSGATPGPESQMATSAWPSEVLEAARHRRPPPERRPARW